MYLICAEKRKEEMYKVQQNVFWLAIPTMVVHFTYYRVYTYYLENLCSNNWNFFGCSYTMFVCLSFVYTEQKREKEKNAAATKTK